MEKVEKILKERINDNSAMFNSSEIEMIIKNINLFSKVYLLGIIDNKN